MTPSPIRAALLLFLLVFLPLDSHAIRHRHYPAPQHLRRSAQQLVPINWIISLGCYVSDAQATLFLEAIPAVLADCYVATTGLGQYVSMSLLRVTCAPSVSASALTSVVLSILQDGANDPCLWGPTFGIVRDKPMNLTSIVAQTPAQWYLDRIDTHERLYNNTFRYAYTGAGVVIYVADTGVRTSHVEFEGRAQLIIDYVTPACNCDCNGHGTHVSALAAGKTYGVAKQALLRMLRVLDCQGNGYSSDVLMAIIEVADRQVAAPHAAILSLSLAGPADSMLDAYVNTLVSNHKVAVAVAAGNNGGDACLLSPARASQVVTVAASDTLDRATYFTNLGSCTKISAPGEAILSAWYTSDTDTRTLSGTSQATPLCAGTLAQLAEVQLPTIDALAIQSQLVALAGQGSVRVAGTLPLLYSGVGLPSPPVYSPSLWPSPSYVPSSLPSPAPKTTLSFPGPPPPPPPPPTSTGRPWWFVPAVDGLQTQGNMNVRERSLRWDEHIIGLLFIVLYYWG